LVCACDSQCAVRENAFRIVYVAEQFFNGPFPRGITLVALLFRESREQRKRVRQLSGQGVVNVIP
jgi:hypothetical protein